MTFAIPKYSRANLLSSFARKFISGLNMKIKKPPTQAISRDPIKEPIVKMGRRGFLSLSGAALTGMVLPSCEKEMKPIIPDLSDKELSSLWDEVINGDGSKHERTVRVKGKDGGILPELSDDLPQIDGKGFAGQDGNPEDN